MGQGDYTHPSYLTRQHAEFGPTVAGASGTSCHAAYPSGLRFRELVGAIAIAGTIGTNVLSIIQAVGTGIIQYPNIGGTNVLTTSTGTVALGTISYGTAGNTVGAVAFATDINVYLPPLSVISIKNGSDATAVTNVILEYYIDPSATWTGQN